MVALAMWLWVFILILALAFFGGFASGRWQLLRHNTGEALVADTIGGRLYRPHLLLNNVTLKTEHGTTQIDHILVMDAGIFLIETKHYGGWIFGDPKGRQWTQVGFQRKSKFQNPTHQNYGHLKAVQALLKLPDESFRAVVVFTGDAKFKTQLGPDLVQLPELIDYLETERRVLFDEDQIAHIVGRIEMSRLRRSIETDEYHLNFVRKRFKTSGL